MTSRTPTSQKIVKVRRIEELGAEVLVVAADVGDPEQMARPWRVPIDTSGRCTAWCMPRGFPKGAFRAVQEIGPKDSEYHFRPKVQGLMALEQVLDGRTWTSAC